MSNFPIPDGLLANFSLILKSWEEQRKSWQVFHLYCFLISVFSLKIEIENNNFCQNLPENTKHNTL